MNGLYLAALIIMALLAGVLIPYAAMRAAEAEKQSGPPPTLNGGEKLYVWGEDIGWED